MLLQELEAMGAFVADAPVQREIKFTLDDDTEHSASIFVKRFSMGEYEKLFSVKDEKYGTSARILAEAIFLGDGKERLSVEKAYRLHKGIATAMLDAFSEVNGGKKA